jgi:hypothetical protein
MASYVDSTFNCTVLRLTDGQSDYGTNTGHNYIRSVFNADDSKVLLYEIESGSFYLVDRATGNVVVTSSKFEFAGSTADETWDRYNPNMIYYELWQSNVLKKADISACTVSNPCDGTHGTSVQNSTVHTFSEYTSLDANNNKRDMSVDGCHLAMGGYYASGTTNYWDAFSYNICTGQKSPVQTCQASTANDFASGMTHNNGMWVVWGVSSGIGSTCQGIWLYDSNMNSVGQLFTGTSHTTSVYDPVSGKDYLLFEASGSGTNSCNGGTTSGIGQVEVDIAPPFSYGCFVSFPYAIGDVHVSSNNTTGWFAAEIGDESGGSPCPSGATCTANDNSTLPSDWSSRWGHLFNEIIVGNISTGTIYRLAHMRSRLTGASPCGGYWAEPRLSMDFSGSYIAFDSSMARTNPPLPGCFQDYVDTYVIKLR